MASERGRTGRRGRATRFATDGSQSLAACASCNLTFPDTKPYLFNNKTHYRKHDKTRTYRDTLVFLLCIRVVPFIETVARSEATTGNNYAITKGLKDSNYERILSSVNPDRIRSLPLSRAINISGFHIRGTAGTVSLITSTRKRITSFWHF